MSTTKILIWAQWPRVKSKKVFAPKKVLFRTRGKKIILTTRGYVRYKNVIKDYTSRNYIITRHYTFSDELQTWNYTYKKVPLPPRPDVFK